MCIGEATPENYVLFLVKNFGPNTVLLINIVSKVLSYDGK